MWGSLLLLCVLSELHRGAALEESNPVSLRCEGGLSVAGLPEEFFSKFEDFQRKYLRDSLTRSREFLYMIYERKFLPNFEEAQQRCLLPVLEIMMSSVLASSVDYSLEDAKGLYSLAVQIAQEAPEDSGASDLLTAWERDTVHIYPFLFGMRPNACHGSSLKVFVYDVPENLTSQPLHCVTGQWGTEVLFHHFFLNSACRTTDPSEADFFYVPIYATCLFTKQELDNDQDAASKIWDPLINFLSSQPWFTRRRQTDHIFLFADGQSARVWDSYDLVRSEAIFMMVESKCPTWGEAMRRYTDVKSCSSSWKDILISGHIDHGRAEVMRRHNKPSESRELLVTFHGRHAGNSEFYENCAVRDNVMELAELDGVDVGGFVDDYLERKGNSHFCLIPGGTSPWTNQLYESILCGCIPVILSDEYEVAFQHILDWSRFSIKWPEAAVGEELYEFLASFTAPQLSAMKSEVDAHSCWFDYFSESRDCSPYLAVLNALEERKRRFPDPGWSRFWNVPASLANSLPKRTTRFHSYNESYLL